MGRVRRFSNYVTWLLGVMDTSGIVKDRSQVSRLQLNRREGEVMAPKITGMAKSGVAPMGIIFEDDSFLRFIEKVRIELDGSVTLKSYSYHYQRPDGYYFRFDKLEQPFADSSKRIIEPQRHLHVAQLTPRCG